MKKQLDNFHDAASMIGNEYRFALNDQMAPLACVVTGVDCSRGKPLFMISLNVDPGVGEYVPGETRLSDVSPSFLHMPKSVVSKDEALATAE